MHITFVEAEQYLIGTKLLDPPLIFTRDSMTDLSCSSQWYVNVLCYEVMVDAIFRDLYNLYVMLLSEFGCMNPFAELSEGSCVMLLNNRLPWDVGDSTCASFGSHLVTLDNPSKQQAVYEFVLDNLDGPGKVTIHSYQII